MKKKRISILILALIICALLLFTGCAAEMPEFMDVQSVVDDTDRQEDAIQQEISAIEEAAEDEKSEPVIVHICGAVVNPGVYELPPGSRIVDAVDKAGGLSVDADESYVNLAAVPNDGEQIFIPTIEESVIMKQTRQETGVSSGKVNINTADKALLCTLPGIGDTRAADIIAYRQEHGNFSSIEDIMQVSGIKEGSFQKIKEMIVVN